MRIAGIVIALVALLAAVPAQAVQQYSNIACETSATSGTGTINLAGAISAQGYLGFIQSGITSGNTVPYYIKNSNKIEVGWGVVTDASPDTLTRAAVITTDDQSAPIDELTLAGTSTVCVGFLFEILTNGAGYLVNADLLDGINSTGFISNPLTSDIDSDGFQLGFDDGIALQSTEGGNAALLSITSVASGVNYLNLSNGATGDHPILTAAGTDSNIGIHLVYKGDPGITLKNDASADEPVLLNFRRDVALTVPEGIGTLDFIAPDSTAVETTYSNIAADAVNITNGDETGIIVLKTRVNNVALVRFACGGNDDASGGGCIVGDPASLSIPQTGDLGFIAGASLNFDDGDCLVTHSAGTLTLSGCTAAGFGGGSQTPWTSNIDMAGWDLTTTNIASGITLNPNSNASYVGLTIDNDSTGATADSRIVMRSGTTAEFIMRADSDNATSEFGTTIGAFEITSVSTVHLGTNNIRRWNWDINGHYAPQSDGTIDIGSAATGVRDLFLTSDVEFNGDTSNTLTCTGASCSIEGSALAEVTDEANSKIDVIGITIDGGGAAPSTGVKGYINIPYNATINSVTMLGDASGSCVVDIWKDTYANYPPVNADSITASAVPTISAATKSQDTTLSGWTTAITAGDVIGFNVDSCSTITRLHVNLKVTKT